MMMKMKMQHQPSEGACTERSDSTSIFWSTGLKFPAANFLQKPNFFQVNLPGLRLSAELSQMDQPRVRLAGGGLRVGKLSSKELQWQNSLWGPIALEPTLFRAVNESCDSMWIYDP